ncbi:hypothetical protein DL765_000142 [Monosporascus sp. GIB2]|nr:hypothetical protein DL765_000142 [Monosporascus sp. GIB2]
MEYPTVIEEFSEQEEQEPTFEEEQEPSSEDWLDEDVVGAWHDRSCNILDLHSYNGVQTCLSCSCTDANLAAHDKAPCGHVYKDIQQRTELRLLLVKPGKFDDDVHCTLVHCNIEKPPSYEAISYTWADEFGDATKNKTIYLSGSPFNVTANCEAALKRVRRHQQWARTIWIDAVCINQENRGEQGHQVQLMPKIYSRARRVFIYLGEPTDEEHEGLEHIAWATSHPDALSCLDRAGYNKQSALWRSVRRAISSLLNRRYFSRVWILQEVALARESTVLCGKYEVSWERLQDRILNRLSVSPLPKVLELGSLKYRESSHLLDLLDLARSSEATDPRDKVFAVFGMINCADSLGYVADYDESVEETYSRIAVLLAETRGLTSILTRALCRRNIQTLPSWVTDWSHQYMDKEPMLIDKVHWDFFPTVLLDKERSEIEFVGARVCRLETLLDADYCVRVFLAGEGHSDQNLVETSRQLESLHRRLDLSRDDSLCVYAMLRTRCGPTCRDVDDFEKELNRHLTEQLKKSDVVKGSNGVFILSGGRDFCFRGLCLLSPMTMRQIVAKADTAAPKQEIGEGHLVLPEVLNALEKRTWHDILLEGGEVLQTATENGKVTETGKMRERVRVEMQLLRPELRKVRASMTLLKTVTERGEVQRTTPETVQIGTELLRTVVREQSMMMELSRAMPEGWEVRGGSGTVFEEGMVLNKEESMKVLRAVQGGMAQKGWGWLETGLESGEVLETVTENGKVREGVRVTMELLELELRTIWVNMQLLGRVTEEPGIQNAAPELLGKMLWGGKSLGTRLSKTELEMVMPTDWEVRSTDYMEDVQVTAKSRRVLEAVARRRALERQLEAETLEPERLRFMRT